MLPATRRAALACAVFCLSFAPDVPPAHAQQPAASFVPCTSARTCVDPNPNDCFVARCIEGRCEYDIPTTSSSRCTQAGNPCAVGQCIPNTGTCALQPVADGTACPDVDGNPCTVASCRGGSCSQAALFATDGTSCPDTDGNSCSVARCQAGRCDQGGGLSDIPPMTDITKVQVTVNPTRVTESEAYTDCGLTSAAQSLEALRPTASGPDRRAPDGGLPERVTFCGKVVRYGINNENNDPRDIMLNMVPSPGFEHFVAGFLNTECTGLSASEKDLFGKGDAACPAEACRQASENPERTGRCIHAEITPAQQFFGKDSRFLPISGSGSCGDGWGCKSALEPASEWSGAPPAGGRPGQDGRDVCVLGVYSIDHGSHRASSHRQLCCSPDPGHDRPEIHTMDGIWFRHPDGGNGWVFGAFQDDSNRYSFPHCSSDHNNNRWSQAPRDLTFRFPFRLPRSPIPWKACIRRTRRDRTSGRDIVPINVTTAALPAAITEVKSIVDGNGALALELVEQVDTETQVRVDGCATADEVSGFITVRVAVGCPRGVTCPGLNDKGDPGSGFYYGELLFQADCNG